MILTPTKTTAGRNATFNASATGTELVLTHLSIGDVGGAIDDTRTALRNERSRVSVQGRRISPDQIHLDALFDDDTAFWVREIGIFADSTLVYYWSTSGAELGYKSAGLEWLVGFDLLIDPIGDKAINVTAAPPDWTLTIVPHLATTLQALADTNRLVLQNHYLN